MAPRVALIGCGAWGRNIARNLAALGALAAICDTDASAAEAAAHGAPLRDAGAVLTDPAIDAVAIATPAATHATLATAALSAGKHVFVEKPLALDVAEAERLTLEQPHDERRCIWHARALEASADWQGAEAPLRRNLPAMLGLVGFFHRVVCGYPTRAVIPYDQRLARLPAYLQQLDMESNGKSVTLAGAPVATPTGPVVWGEPGTNGQHAFFQLLHQGTDVVPVEFIVAAEGHEPGLARHHDLLVANCLAQSEALMKGRTLEEARAQMLAKGVPQDEVEAIAPHRVFPGNRPSLTLMHRRLDPFSLGRLIALYEHRVFVEAQLFGINAFDQWGVELGKELATGLLPVVEGREDAGGRDASTAGLVRHMRSLRAKE